jgi:hypothetical protein
VQLQEKAQGGRARRGAREQRSDEEQSGAETKEDDGSEDGLVTERKEAVPKWEVLAKNKAVWVQL